MEIDKEYLEEKMRAANFSSMKQYYDWKELNDMVEENLDLQTDCRDDTEMLGKLHYIFEKLITELLEFEHKNLIFHKPALIFDEAMEQYRYKGAS